MHKRINNRMFIIFMVTVSMFLLIIGYASINNVNLIISGSANSTGIKSSEDFKVKFTNYQIDNNLNLPEVTISANILNDRKANFTVAGLVGYGESATIKFLVNNDSTYHSAILTDNNTIVNNNPDYFQIERTIVDVNNNPITKIAPGATAYYKIKVNVIKVPTNEEQTANITVYLNATSEPYYGS